MRLCMHEGLVGGNGMELRHGCWLGQEDLKAFLMDNWAPQLQAAFGNQWREHFQAEAGDAEDSLIFQGLLPKDLGTPGRGDPDLLRLPLELQADAVDLPDLPPTSEVWPSLLSSQNLLKIHACCVGVELMTCQFGDDQFMTLSSLCLLKACQSGTLPNHHLGCSSQASNRSIKGEEQQS